MLNGSSSATAAGPLVKVIYRLFRPSTVKDGVLLALASAILGLLGQVAWRYAVPRNASLDAVTFLRLLLDWRVLVGVALYAASTLVWLAALSRGELSKLYPLISVNYALTVLVGWVLFGESITWLKVAGVALILAGVLAVAWS